MIDQPIPYRQAEDAGVIPMINTPARFAVGPSNGLTSNSWRVWNSGQDVYIACRDNAREIKASLHRSGRWRFGFTEEAVKQRPDLVLTGADRAWDVWDKPEADGGGIIAFEIIFLTSELAVRPNQRLGKRWRETTFIEAGPSGACTAVAVFITVGQVVVQSKDVPLFTLAQSDLGDGSWAQVVAYARPDKGYQESLPQLREAALACSRDTGASLPPEAFALFFGFGADGSRFLLPARAFADQGVNSDRDYLE